MTTDAVDEARRTSFDARAELYDAVRPSYPLALVVDVLARTGARRLVEVGAGTGKATARFAESGLELVAVEPGGELVRVLRRNVAAFPNVTVVHTRFESFAETGFDLVYAAQAFHWIDPARRYAKAAAVASWLAIITNEKAPVETQLRRDLDAAYARWYPHPEPLGDMVAKARATWTGEITASGLYEPPHVAAFPWTATYTTRAYLDLLDTYSDHVTLPDDTRTALYGDIADAIELHGGRVEMPYVALAITSRALGGRVP